MEFNFRRFPAEANPAVAEHELWLLPQSEPLRKRRDLARLAVEEGPAGFLRGAGTIREIHVQHDPTLDDMLAAAIVERQLAGETVPAGIGPFCEYAKIAREGRRPGTVPIEISLEGMHSAVRNLAGADLGDPLSGGEFVRQWRLLADRIFTTAEQGADPFKTSIIADDPAFASPRSYLHDQKKVYRQDVENGERWIVRLPGGPPKASGLMLRQPKSLLWKHWARADDEAPLGGSYLFTAVCGEDGNWIFSTDPMHRQPIKGLADVLQAAELGVSGDEARGDPWFDGKPFGHTLVAPPKRGSKLPSKEVLRIARQWARAKKAPPPHKQNAPLQWGLALAVVVALGVSLSAWLKPDPEPESGPMRRARASVDDGTFKSTAEDPSPVRLFVLSIGVSDYAEDDDPATGDSMDLVYPAHDAVELNDAFAMHTGGMFAEMNRASRVAIADSDVVRRRLIAQSRRLIAQIDHPEALPPTRAEVLRGLVWLETGDPDAPDDAPTPNDLVVITISGHGVLDSDGEYYLLASDHRKGDDPRVNGVSFQHEIAKTLNRLPCTVIIILDTCHAGASSKRGESSEVRVTDHPRLPLQENADSAIAYRAADDPDQFQHLVEEAMDNFLKSPRGVLILPACRSVEKAAESREWQHGALSLAVLEALQGKISVVNTEGQECLPREDIVAFADVEYYANNRVPKLTGERQLPQAIATGDNVLKRWIPLANRKMSLAQTVTESSPHASGRD